MHLSLKIRTRKIQALFSQSQVAKSSFSRKVTLQTRKKMMITMVEIAFRLKIYICQQSNTKYFSIIFIRVVLQRQFFEALVRAASIKYSNRSDLPTLADKLDYLFKNKLTVFATKYKAKSIEEEVSGKIIISHFVCRNNSRWLRKSSMSMRGL